MYGGVQRDGNPNTNSGNDIRGVRRNHVLGRIFHVAASVRFGMVAPYTGD